MRLVGEYVALLRRSPDFRRLWLGHVVSDLGDWFATIAVFGVVAALTDRAVILTLVLAARTLPAFLVVPIAGPLVDRWDRRTLLLACDAARALGTLGLLAAAIAGSLIGVFVAIVFNVAMTGIFQPARNAAIPQLVPPEDVGAAMALGGATWSVMAAAGAAIGGWVTSSVGVYASLLLDAGTFAASAALLWALPELPAAGGRTAEGGFVDGLRYVAARADVAAIVACKSMIAVGAGAVALLPLVGDGWFPATAGPAWIGGLYAARGVGALVGSLGLRGWVGDGVAETRRALLPSFLTMGVGTTVIAVAPSVWVAGAGFLLTAIGSGFVWVGSGTLIQRVVDPAFRGRMFALDFGGTCLVMALASAVAGGVVDAGLGTDRAVIAVSGVLVAGMGSLCAFVVARGAGEDA